MTFLYVLKSLHIISLISWFAGIFFLGRMLIYHKEALEENSADIIRLAQGGAKRVWYIITLPSMLLAFIFGTILAIQIGAFREGWMHLKFMLVLIFIAYNFYLNKLRLKLAEQKPTPKSWQLRLINEVPFLFLVAIVFTVYMKDLFSGIWAFLVVVLIAITVTLALIISKKRKK
jgi:putative membrane protein